MNPHHISDYDLTRRQLDSMAGLELFVVEEHLLWRDYCVDRAGKNLRALREKGRAHLDHISTDDMERYANQNIDSTTAARIEDHVRSCQHCADRMLAIGRFLHLVRAGRMTKGYDSIIR